MLLSNITQTDTMESNYNLPNTDTSLRRHGKDISIAVCYKRYSKPAVMQPIGNLNTRPF